MILTPSSERSSTFAVSHMNEHRATKSKMENGNGKSVMSRVFDRDWTAIVLFVGIAALIYTIYTGNNATRADFHAGNNATRVELQTSINATRTELKSEISEDNAALRSEIRDLADKIEASIKAQKELEGANNLLQELLVTNPPEPAESP